jgi:hypothetical protein
MNHVIWYVAEALMADLRTRHHHLRAASEGEVERKVRRRYPEAAAILVRQEESWRQAFSRPEPTP